MNLLATAEPRSPWQGRPARLVAVDRESADVATYEFACDAPSPFVPGQFNMVHLPGLGAAAISISSDPDETATVRHTIRAVGDVTRGLALLEPGGHVLLRGPWGKPWPLAAIAGRDVVIVAGGVGLASLRSAIVARGRGPAAGRTTVLVGGRSPADLLYGREHAAWRCAGLDVRTIVERPDAGWSGPVGLVTGLATDLDLAPDRTSLFCCGPEPMMRAVAAAFLHRGLASADVFLAVERNMACAAGLCGLCQFGPAFVCRDGPIFRHDRIAPFLAVSHM